MARQSLPRGPGPGLFANHEMSQLVVNFAKEVSLVLTGPIDPNRQLGRRGILVDQELNMSSPRCHGYKLQWFGGRCWTSSRVPAMQTDDSQCMTFFL